MELLVHIVGSRGFIPAFAYSLVIQVLNTEACNNWGMLVSVQLNKCSRYLHTLDLAREAGRLLVEVGTLGPDSSKKHSKLHKVDSALCVINVVAGLLVYSVQICGGPGIRTDQIVLDLSPMLLRLATTCKLRLGHGSLPQSALARCYS